jgi:hypothetical protein
MHSFCDILLLIHLPAVNESVNAQLSAHGVDKAIIHTISQMSLSARIHTSNIKLGAQYIKVHKPYCSQTQNKPCRITVR